MVLFNVSVLKTSLNEEKYSESFGGRYKRPIKVLWYKKNPVGGYLSNGYIEFVYEINSLRISKKKKGNVVYYVKT